MNKALGKDKAQILTVLGKTAPGQSIEIEFLEGGLEGVLILIKFCEAHCVSFLNWEEESRALHVFLNEKWKEGDSRKFVVSTPESWLNYRFIFMNQLVKYLHHVRVIT